MHHNDFYDGHYQKGGFDYRLDAERQHLLDVVVPLTPWKTGDRIIEIGAGIGHHAAMLHDAGFEVTAVDASPAAGEQAAHLYPDLDFVVADIAEWEPAQPGHVFARGMSWYHYQLNEVNVHGVDVPAATARLFGRYVAPGRSFVLQIVTDWSGRRPLNGRVHMNQPGEYRRLFTPHGKVSITDWSGQTPPVPLPQVDRGVVVVTET